MIQIQHVCLSPCRIRMPCLLLKILAPGPDQFCMSLPFPNLNSNSNQGPCASLMGNCKPKDLVATCGLRETEPAPAASSVAMSASVASRKQSSSGITSASRVIRELHWFFLLTFCLHEVDDNVTSLHCSFDVGGECVDACCDDFIPAAQDSHKHDFCITHPLYCSDDSEVCVDTYCNCNVCIDATNVSHKHDLVAEGEP